jgi:hypothetical protein
MAVVVISEELEGEINKKFKKESIKIFNLLYSLEDNPKKGKVIGTVGGIVIKELRYMSFRFYFITNGYRLRVFGEDELKDLIFKFVRMSDKKTQQKVINEIKAVLKRMGEGDFNGFFQEL